MKLFFLKFTRRTDKISAYIRFAGRKADFQILEFPKFNCSDYHNIDVVIKGQFVSLFCVSIEKLQCCQCVSQCLKFRGSNYLSGAWGSVVVKALRYQTDGPGVDSRWCHWGIFPWLPPTEPCALKVSTMNFSWGKGGQCVWLTTYHPCSAKVKKIRGLYLPGTPWAISACCGMTFTFTYLTRYR